MKMSELVLNLIKDEDGQGMVEYGLILALIAVVVIVALTSIGDNIKEKFEEVAGKLKGETDGSG